MGRYCCTYVWRYDGSDSDLFGVGVEDVDVCCCCAGETDDVVADEGLVAADVYDYIVIAAEACYVCAVW